MMFSLKKQMLNFRLKKSLKLLEDEIRETPKVIGSLGILWDGLMPLDEMLIKDLATSLQIPFKNISIIMVGVTEAIQQTASFEILHLNTKDLGWLGKLPDSTHHFTHSNWDLILNFFDSKNPLLSFISAESKGKLRLGFAKTDLRLNDLIFHLPSQEKNLFVDEAVRYIKIIITT